MVAFHNASLRRGYSATPYKLFTGQEAPWSISDFRGFGCPAYVLHKHLQDGDNYNKGRSRCWQGIYIGPSTCHVSNIPLIYNPTTTHIFPQFHVTYDEGFTSVLNQDPSNTDLILSKLYAKATWYHQSIDPSTEYHFNTFWTQPTHLSSGSKRSHVSMSTMEPQAPRDCFQALANAHITNQHEGVSSSADPTQGVSSGSTDTKGVSPQTISAEGVSPHYQGQQAVSVPGHSPLPEVSSSTIPSEGASHLRCSSPRKPQYHLYQVASQFTSLKHHKGINHNLYIYHVPLPGAQSFPDRYRDQRDPILSHPFSSFGDLPVLYTKSSIQAFLAVDNKEDTLT